MIKFSLEIVLRAFGILVLEADEMLEEPIMSESSASQKIQYNLFLYERPIQEQYEL